jgi:hypothetical protein
LISCLLALYSVLLRLTKFRLADVERRTAASRDVKLPHQPATLLNRRLVLPRSFLRLFMSVLALFMCLLTVLLSRGTVFLCFFVFSLFVMMHRFAVVMGCRLVMPGGIVVGLTCGMFHGHESCPFKKHQRQAILPFGKTSGETQLKSFPGANHPPT